jgi:uncharacterized cupin superfamily protein
MALVNESDLEWSRVDGDGMRVDRKRLGGAGGGERLGCSLYRLPAGERSWPYHYHTANEEAIYVLEGTGSIRIGEGTYDIEPGDYAAFPADESGGYRVINDSGGVLRYLMLSTMDEPDLTVYPDSGKVGVFAGSPPGGTDERSVSGYFRLENRVDYWTDEE